MTIGVRSVVLVLISSLVLLSGCGEENIQWKSIEEVLQMKLIRVKEYEVIVIPEGHYKFKKSMLIDGKDHVVIKGAGIGKTFLSFADQEEGAEGIKISNCKDVALEDFTIQDARGDNIKVTDTNGLILRRVKSEWTGGPKQSNGSYGFYPVLCTRVLIENCVAVGASDAGIYVGQSDSVIIRNNLAYHNVAGIESENSRWVEIHGNDVYRNTGGILVFDLPGLTQTGHSTRVYKNIVRSNNLGNFAPKGNIVASVPAGTGLMFLATRKVEVFENEISDNRTIGTAIVSYELVKALGDEANEGEVGDREGGSDSQMAGNISDYMTDETYNPYPGDIFIYSNVFTNKHWLPTLSNDIGRLFLVKFPFSTPDIAVDGILPENGSLNLCLSDNGDFKFTNLDAGHDFAALTADWSSYDCRGESIGEVILP